MLRIQVPLLLLACGLILLGGAYIDTTLRSRPSDAPAQVAKSMARQLERAAPALVKGRVAEWIDDLAVRVEEADIQANFTDDAELKTMQGTSDGFKRTFSCDVVLMVDATGKVLFSSDPRLSRENISGLPVVDKLLRGIYSDDTVRLKENDYVTIGGPVVRDGKVRGGIVLGWLLSGDLPAVLGRQLDATIMYVQGVSIVHSTDRGFDGIVQAILSRPGFAEEYKTLGEAKVFDGPMGAAVFVPLAGSLRGVQAALALVPNAAPRAEEVGLLRRYAFMLTSLLLVLGIAVLGGYLISRGIMGELGVLEERVREATSKGDSAVIQTKAFPPELRPLAEAIRTSIADLIAAPPAPVAGAALSLSTSQLPAVAPVAPGPAPTGPSVTASDSFRSAIRSSQVRIPTLAPGAGGDSSAGLRPARPAGEAAGRIQALLDTEGDSPAEPRRPAPTMPPAARPTASSTIRPAGSSGAPKEEEAEVAAAASSLLDELLKSASAPRPAPSAPAVPTLADVTGTSPGAVPVKAGRPGMTQAGGEDIRMTLGGGPGQDAVQAAAALAIAAAGRGLTPDELKAEESHFDAVFLEYVEMRKRLDESVDQLSKKKFFETLSANRDRMIKSHGCRTVQFSVVEKNGRASIKAVPVR